MSTIVQFLRSLVAGSRPAGRVVGEVYVNIPDRQLGVVDAAGAAQDLLAVRPWVATASYSTGDVVLHSGALYGAKAAVAPGAWDATQWTDLAAPYLPLAGGTMTGPLVIDSANALRIAPAGLVNPEVVIASSNQLNSPKLAFEAKSVRGAFLGMNASNHMVSLQILDATGANPHITQSWTAANSTIQGGLIINRTAGALDGLRITATGPGPGNAILVEDETHPDSTPWLVDVEGTCVSGHTQALPCANLFGSQMPRGAGVQQHGMSARTAANTVAYWHSDPLGQTAAMYALLRSNGNLGTHTAVADADVLGYYAWEGSDGTEFVRAAYVRGVVDGPVSAGKVPGAITFHVTDSTGDMNERLRINDSGTRGGSIRATQELGLARGGAATQIGMRTNPVNVNAPSGAITLASVAGSTTWTTCTVNCTSVRAIDTVIAHQSAGADQYMVHVTGVRDGAFDLTFATTGGTATESPVINFAIIRAERT